MEENYFDWEFMLDGDHNELRQLASCRGSAYLNIFGGVDDWLDCPSDDFRMNTLYAQDETDAHTVWQLGYELLGLYNGASVLFNMNARKLSIHRLLYKGSGVNREPAEMVPALLGPANFPQSRIDEELAQARKDSAKLTLVQLATENQDICFVLKYLDMEPGWVTYYKLMEALEVFAKEKSVDLGTNGKDRDAFTNTANNFSLSGFESRHGFKQVVKANKTRSMDLPEAHAFVTTMAKRFLRQTYFKPA